MDLHGISCIYGPSQAKNITRKAPFVEIITVQAEVLRSTVSTSGTVRPRTQTDLLAEVPGIIEAVAPFPKSRILQPPFEQVDFFRANDLLLRIEDVDLKTAVAESVANLSRANLQLIQERELAKQARIEWEDGTKAKAPELVRRIPQIQKAEAEAKAAEAKLTQARHNLDRAQSACSFRRKDTQDYGRRGSACRGWNFFVSCPNLRSRLSRGRPIFEPFGDAIPRIFRAIGHLRARKN